MTTTTADRRGGRVVPVTVCHGTDDALRRTKIVAIADRIRDTGELDTSTIDAAELTPGELAGWLHTPSLFGDRRLLIIDNGADLTAADLDELRSLDGDYDDHVIVSLAKARPTKPFKGLQAESAQVGRRAIDAQTHVTDVLAQHGVQPGRGTVKVLAEMLAGRLHRTDEIARTAVTLGGTLDAETAAQLAGDGGDVAPWTLTDAIEAGDTTATAKACHGMLSAGRHPLQVMASLTKMVDSRFALVAHRDAGRRLDEAAVTELTGLRGYPARKALGAGRDVALEQAAAARQLVAAARADMTGGSALDPGVVLLLLCCRLAAR